MAHLFLKEISVNNHKVSIEIDRCKNVMILVDGEVWRADADRVTKVKLALAARRLWREALAVLPPGVYQCFALGKARMKVYLAAGWRHTPLSKYKGGLVFYHKVPPLPEGWMKWMK